jgi:periplasmic protein TonB
MTQKEQTTQQSVRFESMEEMVFAKRNKAYGAYDLRKRYAKHVLIAFLVGIFLLGCAVSKPLIEAYRLRGKEHKRMQKKVEAVMENMKQEEEPPPPPPPPPPAAIEQQVRFTAPVVVDEEVEDVQLATAEEMSDVVNEAPPEEITIVEDVKDEVVDESKEEGVWFVEENATFQGGDLNTFSTWVLEHIQYPAQASEAGITGKVIVQFSVGRDGTVMNAKVIRSVHPSLDNEAIRVILSSPRWQPAKQSGNPVKQNYVIPIMFTLQ